MTWSTEENVNINFTITCNNRSYDATGLVGMALAEKIKSIARENGISKFDVIDSNMQTLSSDSVINGNFDGNLTIVRFNSAA